MLWSFPAGRFAGTTVRIHVTFLLLLAWIWLDSYFASGTAAASRALVFIVAVFACVVAHEFGHVLVARLFGVHTPDITLYPFGGIARLNTMPQAPMQEFLIAIAGPVVNVIIAAALILVGARLTSTGVGAFSNEQVDLASRVATANVILAVFNMIPAFPMDGGRVLRAALAAGLGFQRATRLAATIGHWFAIALALLGLFSNPMLIVIAIFIYFAASAELQATNVRAFSKDLPVARAMITEFSALPAQASVADAVESLLRTSQKVIPVIGEAGNVLGVLEIGNVVRALQEQDGKLRSVADIMTQGIPTLRQNAKLDEAFRLLQEKTLPAVAVVDDSRRLSGLVTLETLGEMLMLHEASDSVFDRLQSRTGPRPLASRPIH
jgi:Zn-dependent protease/CBS domain-containing protein